MTVAALELHGIKNEPNGSTSVVLATVFAAERDRGRSVWSCTVRCPAFFDSDKKIAGVDREQALQLAKLFLSEMFEHHGVRLTETKYLKD